MLAGLLLVGVALTVTILAVLWQITGLTQTRDSSVSVMEIRGADAPEGYELDGSTLWILDGEGRRAWSVPVDEPGMIEKTRPLLEDVDQDGFKEVLFNHRLRNNKKENGKLMCFDHDGSVLWDVPYGELPNGRREHRFHGRYFEPYFSGEHFEWLETPAGSFVLTVARHAAWYPAQVALVRPDSGDVVSAYWHPGWIYAVTPFDVGRDGTMELLIGGANNPDEGPGRPGLAVLNIPFAEPAGEKNFFGAWNQRELRYVVFPMVDVFEVQTQGFAVREINVQGPDRVQIIVGRPPQSHVYYYLDRNLRVIDMGRTDFLVTTHDQLFRDKHLDHEYSRRELEQWGRFAVVPTAPDGNSAEVELLFKPHPVARSAGVKPR